jgi:SagB-type dehydrogenase family enzyme
MVLAGLLFFTGIAGAQGVKLPAPAFKGRVSLEETLKARRTVRHFAARGLTLTQVSQILWAAAGVSDIRGFRTAPSAGATYPLEVYLVAGDRGVENLPPGVYRYLSGPHSLAPVLAGDVRTAVVRVSLHQAWMAEAPIMVVFAAEFRRCTDRYGQRGVMYTHMEVGHAGQNLFLQAEALGLGAGIVGAFEERALTRVLKLPLEHEPLLIMPVGYRF